MADVSIQQLIERARTSVVGQADENADFYRGSDYESLAGANAVLFSRQAMRDDDMFGSIRLDSARGQNLTDRVKKIFGVDRVLDTRGTGTATLTRPASGIAETIWRGTRFRVGQYFYRTTSNTPVLASDTRVVCPIEAIDLGPAPAIQSTATIEDLLVDSTWSASVNCSPGTVFEPADQLRARVKKDRFDNRVGQATRIVEVCQAAGATYVANFRSDFGGDGVDHGLNVVYVGDLGYRGTPSLVRACTVALRKCRVQGDHMQVLPMAAAVLDVSADVTLSKSPADFDTITLSQVHYKALARYLNGSDNGFTYSLTGLAGAIIKQSVEVQGISFVTPSTSTTILSGGNFPAVLNRYRLGSVSLRYHAP